MPTRGVVFAEVPASFSEVQMASTTVHYARALRPFQTRRLLRALADLQARAAHIGGVMARLAETEADGPVAYAYELGEAMDCCADLSEAAGEVFDACSEAFDRTDRDWERAVEAMLIIGRGLAGDEAPTDLAA